jgi:hypothetical protein
MEDRRINISVNKEKRHEELYWDSQGKTKRLIGIVNIFLSLACEDQIRWVLCHHGTARPQVADGGDGLQIWRVAANILNKQSRTADKGWSSSLGVGRGTNNSSA